MPEFLKLLAPLDGLALLMENLPDVEVTSERVATGDALGAVTAGDIRAPHSLPAFPRSTVDGYAVCAKDTYGASESLPIYLTQIGEVAMGGTPGFVVTPGECALIHTGGMVPVGADAVVMIEQTQAVRPGEIEFLRAVGVGENVLRVGEDVEENQVVIPVGTRLRAAEIGGAMALGFTELEVAQKPRIGIISSGDEVVPPKNLLQPGQVRDINTYTLSARVHQWGGVPVSYGISRDRFKELKMTAQKALGECEVVVITAGSSASARDLTAQVIDGLGAPGVLVHGVNVRPGKPTILGSCNGKAVIGLPGNPVSALVIADLFVKPVVEKLLGLRDPRPSGRIYARLSINLSSQSGREDWIPVRLVKNGEGWDADPIFGKSNLIFTLARADGLIRIPADSNGLEAQTFVDVLLFE